MLLLERIIGTKEKDADKDKWTITSSAHGQHNCTINI